MSATRPEAWEVWWVRWWHEDAHAPEDDPSKQRFALCLGDLSGLGKPDRFVFCKISSEDHAFPRVEMDPAFPGFDQTGLKEKSYVYVRDVKEMESADAIWWAGTIDLGHVEAVRRVVRDAMLR